MKKENKYRIKRRERKRKKKRERKAELVAEREAKMDHPIVSYPRNIDQSIGIVLHTLSLFLL